jgi:hypothetical protein
MILMAAALLGAAPASARLTSPAQYEMEIWRAFKAQDMPEIRQLFAPDVGVYSEQAYGLVRKMQHVTIQRYKLGKMSSSTVAGGDVRLIYTMAVRGLWDGKPLSERLLVASLWHRDRARWRCIEHAELSAG